jgi:hypothetical protein
MGDGAGKIVGFMGRNHQKWRNSWDLANKMVDLTI